MSTITCTNIIIKLNQAIDTANYTLVDNMTKPDMQYDWVCIRPDCSYEFYYQILKEYWDKIINDFINQPNQCNNILSNLLGSYRSITAENIAHAQNILRAIESSNSKVINIDDIVLDVISTSIMDKTSTNEFELSPVFLDSMTNLGKILGQHCKCQVIDIYKTFVNNYKKKYYKKFEGHTKDEIIELLRKDYQQFKNFLADMNTQDMNQSKNHFLDKIANNLTGLYGFSVQSELDKLIPNELGSLKQFFVTVISKYYNNLHPIIWTQIFKGLTENVFIDLPLTSDELFSFGSKQLLLNSGPFILKILQMIRPVLTPELASKYNLTKLTYPVLKPNEIQLILNKVVYDWPMYKILQNFSASVGHVSKVVKVDNPSNPFIIKIIKPLAVAQSCWEYKTLYDTYPTGSCEQAFIINMLESNGRELNVKNEIININKGHEVYTATYQEVFGIDLNAKLTTVENIPGIIDENSWYALTMTLAPGIALSKLIENDELKLDTKYRAKLHRCLDILVFKYFHNIIKNGYYHGDLHSGNIYYSFEQSQMTLIDFGAVGDINIYENDQDTNTLLEIVVMSIFYNYDEMLDTMTVLLNNRCTKDIGSSQIDMNSQSYLDLKAELCNHKLNNIRNQELEQKKTETYQEDIFGEKRIQDEKSTQITHQNIFNNSNVKSIYSYLEYEPDGPEIVIENKDVLPQFTQIIGESTSISFSGVLERIIKFYALSGVNIAIKFNEFYEFQKAYTLLLGVLYKVGYNSYRSAIAIKKAIVNLSNIPELLHVGSVSHVIKQYWDQHSKYDQIVEQVNQGYNKCIVDKVNLPNKSNKSNVASKMNATNISSRLNRYSQLNKLDAQPQSAQSIKPTQLNYTITKKSSTR